MRSSSSLIPRQGGGQSSQCRERGRTRGGAGKEFVLLLEVEEFVLLLHVVGDDFLRAEEEDKLIEESVLLC